MPDPAHESSPEQGIGEEGDGENRYEDPTGPSRDLQQEQHRGCGEDEVDRVGYLVSRVERVFEDQQVEGCRAGEKRQTPIADSGRP